jgi:hypothetical protein
MGGRDAIPAELARQIPQWEKRRRDELRLLDSDLVKYAVDRPIDEEADALARGRLSLDLPQSVRRRIRR